jgi:hypothetical protein
VVSHHSVARDIAESGLMRMVRVLAVVLPSVALLQVLVSTHDYRQPVVAIAAWLGVLGAGAWLVPRLRSGRFGARETTAAIAVAAGAVAAIGLAHRPHDGPGNVDLSILGTIWLLALVVMSRPALAWITGAVLVFAVHGGLLIRYQGLAPLSLSVLAAGGYIMATLLIVLAAVRPAVATQAGVAARRAALASMSSAERTAAVAIQQERQGRLAVLRREVLPLLNGIADGTLDPSSSDVRQQCARQAAVLRQSLLTRPAPVSGDLTVALEPTLGTARGRGLAVTIQLIGDPGVTSPQVTRALAATVDAVMRELPPQQVMLTVLAHDDDLELYLTFGLALATTPDLSPFGLDLPAGACWHAAIVVTEAGGGCLEVSWRKGNDG